MSPLRVEDGTEEEIPDELLFHCTEDDLLSALEDNGTASTIVRVLKQLGRESGIIVGSWVAMQLANALGFNTSFVADDIDVYYQKEGHEPSYESTDLGINFGTARYTDVEG